MKTKVLIIAIGAFFLFYAGSCNSNVHNTGMLIQNNSDIEIAITGEKYRPENRPLDLSICIDVYDYFYRDWGIKPHSGKYFRGLSDLINILPQDTAYIYVFNRIDIDTMTCEEFNEKLPIKKMWALTKKEAEAMDWTLTYP